MKILFTCFFSLFGDRYDRTTGVPDNGNDWRKFRAVPRSYPLRSLVFVLRLIGLETKNVLDYQGRAGDHFHCTVERSPGHIRCRKSLRGVHLLSHCDLLSRRTLCGHHFPGNCRHLSSQRRVHSVVNLGGVVKTLRRIY